MSSPSLVQLTLQLSNIQQNLSRNLSFTDVLPQIDDMIQNAPRTQRTTVNLPEIDPWFRDELRELTKALRENEHPEVDAAFIDDCIQAFASDQVSLRRDLIRFLSALIGDLDGDERRLSQLYDGLADAARMTSHITEPHNKAAAGQSLGLIALSMLLHADQKSRHFLTKDQVQSLVLKLAMVGVLEHDERGMVEGQGWLHAYAVMPDLAAELCHHKELGDGDRLLLLSVMVENYRLLGAPLAMGENDDLAELILSLMDRKGNLFQDFFSQQLQDWQDDLDDLDDVDNMHEADWHRLFNYRRLMQSLFIDPRLPEELRRPIWSSGDSEND